MAGSVNKVILVGHVGAEPEIRRVSESGGRVATFSVATNAVWKDRTTGERREKTDWHRVVCFDPIAGVVEQYVHKGTQLYVEGKLQTRKWQDASGQTRYTTEVVVSGPFSQLTLLGGRGDGGSGSAEQGTGKPSTQEEPFDDELPF